MENNNKTKIKSLKNYIKEESLNIKNLKTKRIGTKGYNMSLIQMDIFSKKIDIRHALLAYATLRGKDLLKTEKENSKPYSQYLIDKIINKH